MNFRYKSLKGVLSVALIITSSAWFSSCHIVPDQGPTGINKLQKEQAEGTLSTEDYVIVDITQENLPRYNKEQYEKKGTIPKLNSAKLYTDEIRPYDRLSLLVIDTAVQGPFAKTNGPVVCSEGD